jgi:hypothetical protein
MNPGYNTYIHGNVTKVSQWNFKQKCLFSKTENRKIKQVLSGCWYQWEGENIRKGCRRMNLVEILCSHVWKWKNETCWNYSKYWGEKKIKENEVNSTMIHCKNFCKCYSVPLVQQYFKKKNWEGRLGPVLKATELAFLVPHSPGFLPHFPRPWVHSQVSRGSCKNWDPAEMQGDLKH